jgi:hypothetical protein
MFNTTVISVITTTKMITITTIIMIMPMTMITSMNMMATITIVTTITTAAMRMMMKTLILVKMGVLSSLAAQMAIVPFPDLLDLQERHVMRDMVVTLQSQVLLG